MGTVFPLSHGAEQTHPAQSKAQGFRVRSKVHQGVMTATRSLALF